jgi:hypothetical protein
MYVVSTDEERALLQSTLTRARSSSEEKESDHDEDVSQHDEDSDYVAPSAEDDSQVDDSQDQLGLS